MAFHGTADPIVTYEGRGLERRHHRQPALLERRGPDDVPVHEGVDHAMDNWAAHNGCEPGRQEERISTRSCAHVGGLRGRDRPYVVEGGGHVARAADAGVPRPSSAPPPWDTRPPLMFDFFLGPPGRTNPPFGSDARPPGADEAPGWVNQSGRRRARQDAVDQGVDGGEQALTGAVVGARPCRR